MSNINLIAKGFGTGIEFTTFSDGSETCKVHTEYGDISSQKQVRIQCKIEDCTRDLVRIGLVKDALDRLGVKEVKLTLFYIPQARADRVFEKGMPLPIKVFTDILNSFNFAEVTVMDPHSDVSAALINNVEIIDQTQCLINKLSEIEKYMPEFTLCAPDLGAAKKIFDSVQALRHEDYLQAVKIRDVKTGDIVKCDLLAEEVEGDVLIVDDLCDGAASFKFLTQKLKERGARKVGLYITHGIFSKGLDVLEKDVDFIFCPDIVCNYINNEDIWRFNER